MAHVGHWNPLMHQPPVPQYCFRSFRSLPFPFGTCPQASHTPDLGVGGFERAAPTAADPREKLLSDPWRRRGSEAQKTLRVVITYRGVAPPWGAASKALTVNGSAGFYEAVEVDVAC